MVYFTPIRDNRSPIISKYRYIGILRKQRNDLLAESDWTQTADNALSSDKKTEWTTYRTNLRNLPANFSSVDDAGFAWPTKPS